MVRPPKQYRIRIRGIPLLSYLHPCTTCALVIARCDKYIKWISLNAEVVWPPIFTPTDLWPTDRKQTLILLPQKLGLTLAEYELNQSQRSHYLQEWLSFMKCSLELSAARQASKASQLQLIQLLPQHSYIFPVSRCWSSKHITAWENFRVQQRRSAKALPTMSAHSNLMLQIILVYGFAGPPIKGYGRLSGWTAVSVCAYYNMVNTSAD